MFYFETPSHPIVFGQCYFFVLMYSYHKFLILNYKDNIQGI